MLDRFERLLASEDSATEALTDWCRSRGFAADPIITARPVRGPPQSPPEDVRERLNVGSQRRATGTCRHA